MPGVQPEGPLQFWKSLFLRQSTRRYSASGLVVSPGSIPRANPITAPPTPVGFVRMTHSKAWLSRSKSDTKNVGCPKAVWAAKSPSAVICQLPDG